MVGYTITALNEHHLLQAARRAGVDLKGEPLGVGSFEARIPFEGLMALWCRAMDAVDVSFALRAGVSAKEDERSPLTILCATRSTGFEALSTMERFYPVITDAYRWVVDRRGEMMVLTMVPSAPFEGLGWESVVEFDVGDLVQTVLGATAGEVKPQAVCLPYAERAGLGEACERILGIRPSFGALRAEIIYPKSGVAMRLPFARPGLAHIIEPQLKASLARCTQTSPIEVRVKAHLPELLEAGSTTGEDMARRLGLGRRTMERQLSARGWSFQRLLDNLRLEMALQRLPHQTVQAVSEALGYTDPRSFNRAFLRWTGQTPARVRRELKGYREP